MDDWHYDFAKDIFKKYKNAYRSMLFCAEDIVCDHVVWSDSYLEFYPYQREMDQVKKTKYYKSMPASTEGVVTSKFKGGAWYYSYREENRAWGSVFLISEEEAQCYLIFTGDDEVTLDQIFVVRRAGGKIEEVLYYSGFNEGDEEIFMIDRYSYNGNGSVSEVTRSGFYEGKGRLLPVRGFRFEYADGNVLIYSNQLKANGTCTEELLCKTKAATIK